MRSIATVAVLVAFVGACCPKHAAKLAAGTEVVVGQVHSAGSAEMEDIELMPDSGAGILLRGAQAELLRKVDGLRIAATGARSGHEMVVERFTVISAGGLPATDGTLSERGGALVLTTGEGAAHVLVRPSPVLRAHVGARVWVAGSLSEEIVSYGVIQ